jgi:hypothetical protein
MLAGVTRGGGAHHRVCRATQQRVHEQLGSQQACIPASDRSTAGPGRALASACHRRPQHRGPAQRRSERLLPITHTRFGGASISPRALSGRPIQPSDPYRDPSRCLRRHTVVKIGAR